MAARGGVEIVIGAQRHHDPPDVDEVEADDEQVIDGVGEHFIAVERLDEKGAAVLVQRSGYPDRDRNRNHEIDGIRGENV